jgi:hypothetical protein
MYDAARKIEKDEEKRKAQPKRSTIFFSFSFFSLSLYVDPNKHRSHCEEEEKEAKNDE